MAKILTYHGPTMEGPKVPSEAREARSAGAPSGLGPGEGRRSPSPVMGSGGYAPRKFFKKINVEIAYFQAFLQAKNKMVSSAVSARHVRLGSQALRTNLISTYMDR